MAASPLRLGIEIGGTKLQLGLGRDDGRIEALERRAIRPEAGAEGILAQIVEAYRTLGDRAGGEPIAGVGVGFGGPVDVDRGVVVRSHQVEGWADFPLADRLRADLGVDRVAIANDADAAGLGEARSGAGAGLSPVFYVTIGSGIGGGLILDGRIYRGAGRGAAEIGHVLVHDGAGRPVTLESLASGWAIGRQGAEAGLVAAGGGLIDGRGVARAAGEGDERALAIFDRATRAMAEALGHVVALVGPRRIILGGGASLVEPGLWIDPIRTHLDRRAFGPFRGSYDLTIAALGESAVVVGALAVAADARA